MRQKPIRVTEDIYDENVDKAIEAYNAEVAKGEHDNIWLVCSGHDYSKGYWLEFEKPILSVYDSITKEYHKATAQAKTEA